MQSIDWFLLNTCIRQTLLTTAGTAYLDQFEINFILFIKFIKVRKDLQINLNQYGTTHCDSKTGKLVLVHNLPI